MDIKFGSFIKVIEKGFSRKRRESRREGVLGINSFVIRKKRTAFISWIKIRTICNAFGEKYPFSVFFKSERKRKSIGLYSPFV